MSPDPRLGVEILATYARVRLLLRRRGVDGALAALRSGRPDAPPPSDEEAWRCAYAVVRVLRLLPADSRCLVRSLVLVALLARRGATPELVIGVVPAPAFGAHAWVELGGTPLLKPGAARDGRLVVL